MWDWDFGQCNFSEMLFGNVLSEEIHLHFFVKDIVPRSVDQVIYEMIW